MYIYIYIYIDIWMYRYCETIGADGVIENLRSEIVAAPENIHIDTCKLYFVASGHMIAGAYMAFKKYGDKVVAQSTLASGLRKVMHICTHIYIYKYIYIYIC